MRQTFHGKLGLQLRRFSYAVLAGIIMVFSLPLGTPAQPTGWFWFIMAFALVLTVTAIAYVARRPVLTLDDQGLSFAWLIGNWTISWADVVHIERQGVAKGRSEDLGFRLVHGTSGASTISRAICGYDRILSNYWGMSMDEFESTVRRAMAGEVPESVRSNLSYRRAPLGSVPARAFGRRNAPPSR